MTKTVEQAKQLGGKVIIPPQKLPDGDELAILHDAEGIPFGVYRANRKELGPRMDTNEHE